MLQIITNHKTYKLFIQHKLKNTFLVLCASLLALFLLHCVNIPIFIEVLLGFIACAFQFASFSIIIETLFKPQKCGVSTITKLIDSSTVKLKDSEYTFSSMDAYLGRNYSYRIGEEVYWVCKNDVYYMFKKY